jgi:hypothetical protein
MGFIAVHLPLQPQVYFAPEDYVHFVLSGRVRAKRCYFKALEDGCKTHARRQGGRFLLPFTNHHIATWSFRQTSYQIDVGIMPRQCRAERCYLKLLQINLTFRQWIPLLYRPQAYAMLVRLVVEKDNFVGPDLGDHPSELTGFRNVSDNMLITNVPAVIAAVLFNSLDASANIQNRFSYLPALAATDQNPRNDHSSNDRQ